MKSLSIALLLFLSSPCDSQVTSHQGFQILEFGIFRKIVSGDDLRAPGAIAGARHAVSQVTLIECTTNVPARIGTSFGFRLKLPGKPSEEIVSCTSKCVHPKLTDPSSGRSNEVEQWDTPGLAGQDGYIGYTFDNDWELVPGRWTIQVFADSKLVAEKTFNVYAPPKR